MEQKQLDALDRRNTENWNKVNEKLDSIDRALRGHNGDTGLVADVKLIKREIEDIDKTLVSHSMTLYGCPEDNDDVGLVGEQKDLRKIADRRVWVNRAISAAAVGILADVLLRYI